MGDILNLAELISKFVLVAGGLFAAFKGIAEWKEQRIQKRLQLTWTRSREAYAIVDQMLGDPLARRALYMLDWEREYELPTGNRVFISRNDLLVALRTDFTIDFSEMEAHVRDCFDALFDHLERMEHALRIALVEQSALEHPVSYYADNMAADLAVFENFLRHYKYDRALSFLLRFESWRKLSAVSTSAREVRVVR
jgi:hypothetical protein